MTHASPGDRISGPGIAVLLLAILTGCDSSGVLPMIQPDPMRDPVGQSMNRPSQLPPEYSSRVSAEREPLPVPPPAPDPGLYGNLGTVPPKPALPTPQQIAGETRELEAEQQGGAERIARQAGAPIAETLMRPNAAGTRPANPAFAGGSPTAAAAPVIPSNTLRMSGDNQAFLPQSETVEASDLMDPGAR